jgi:hypothetical protein
MNTITKTQLNETRGFKYLVSSSRLEELKKLDQEDLIELSEVPEYRFDHIEISENYIQVIDRGVQNSDAPSGYADATTTWTTQEWDKKPWE